MGVIVYNIETKTSWIEIRVVQEQYVGMTTSTVIYYQLVKIEVLVLLWIIALV